MRRRLKAQKPKAALSSLNNSRTFALYRVGLQLLAENDCDAVSVAHIAKLAECSVGAFYERFPDKNTYLIFLIRNSFHTELNKLKNELPAIASRGLKLEPTIAAMISYFLRQFSGEKLAGVVRVALKLAPTHRKAMAPLSEYRDMANECVFEILKSKTKRRDLERRVQESMQMLFAVLFDAIQQNHGAMRLNSPRTNAILTRQFLAHLSDKSKLPSGGVFNKQQLGGINKKIAEIEVPTIKMPGAKTKPKSPNKNKTAKRRNVKIL